MIVWPPFATVEDLAQRGVDVSDESRAEGTIDDVSNLVHEVSSQVWIVVDGDGLSLSPDVPPVIRTITIKACRRALVNPNSLDSLTLEDFGYKFRPADGDVYLTRAERSQIRAAAGKPSIGTIRGESLDPLTGPDFDGIKAGGAFDPLLDRYGLD